MKKKVVLVYPGLAIQSGTFLQTPFSLLTIAPYLIKEGFEVVLVDTRLHHYRTILRQVIDENTLFVGITSMTGSQIVSAIEVSKYIKTISKVPVVWGGIHSTLLPDQVIREPFVDYVLAGEGEINIGPFAHSISENKPPENINGVYFKRKGEVAATPQQGFFDLSKSLIPAWDLIDNDQYNNIGLQTGRGCPYPCTYCYNIEFNQQRWRTKPLELIFEEIHYLMNRFRLDSLFFYDDNFFTNKKRVEDICRFLIDNKYQVKWYTTCRADYFTRYGKDFFKLVRESGCETLALGLESGSQRILDQIKKMEKIEDYINMARITSEVGIVPECGFMIGIPGETDEDRRMTFDLMDRLIKINPKAYVTSLAIYTPYPGAPLIKTIERDYNFKMPQHLSDWCTFDFHSCNLAWLNKKEKKRLVTMSYVPRFVFWKQKLKERYITGPLLPFYYVMTFLAGLRWKNRFFSLSFEYSLLQKFLRLRQNLNLKKIMRFARTAKARRSVACTERRAA
ncbi:MAG: B12-binding domain-containing radical SAM protein [Deltaproteobacteria bacterium]|nr:B12-binding domain-containing radical SAM protein [Deltaproteobacteria bacterium]